MSDEHPGKRDPAVDWPPSARAQLGAHGLRAKRTLGQNFLADVGLCDKIAALCAPGDDRGSVLEIGAGLGALTDRLLERGHLVVAVETDRELCAVLRGRFRRQLEGGQLRLIEGDVRDVDLASELDRMAMPRTLAGNLPYHLSGLLLRRAVEVAARVSRCAFLLQLEVVERLCASPGTGAYGALSVFAQAVYAPERAFVVKRGAFYPQPGVDSASVVLTPRSSAPVEIAGEFTALVRASFEKRRKTLRNAWKGQRGLTADELEEAARAAGLDLAVRGETLSVVQFARMAEAVRALRRPGGEP